MERKGVELFGWLSKGKRGEGTGRKSKEQKEKSDRDGWKRRASAVFSCAGSELMVLQWKELDGGVCLQA